MLKFFRLYQKYILTVGAVILMVAFLIPQATNMFTPGPGSQVVGTVDGEKLRQRDIEAAAADLHILGSLNPYFTVLYKQDATAWALAVREAEKLGLSAGPQEIDQVLAALQVDDTTLQQLASRIRTNPQFIRNALRHFVMVENYRSLALGQTRVQPLERLATTVQLAQYYPPDIIPGFVNHVGATRLSPPLFQRITVDLASTVSGKLLVIPADKAAHDIPEPTEADLQALFDQYKDQFPTADAIGYRIPPRVKIDWLAIPFDAVLQTVDVDEVDAIAFFEQDPARFNSADGKTRDYAAARADVLTALRHRKAQDKIDLMIRRARAILLEAPEFRKLTEDDGYKVLPDGYTPLSFRVVADTIEQEFAVRPDVHFERDNWLTLPELSNLPGLGDSSLADRGDVFFLNYVNSAREMKPAEDNPLVGLRLQTNVVSLPMRSREGSRFLFRLLAAEPDQPPANLDAVRDQVTADARKRAAFTTMTADAGTWKSKAAEQGLDALASSLGETLIDLPAVRRVGADEKSIPALPGVGSSAEFINAVYAAADALLADDTPLADVPEAQRLVVVPLESRSELAVFRLDDYRPISQADYDRYAANPQWMGYVDNSLYTEELPDPLDYKSLAAATGFQSNYRGDDEEDENAEPTPETPATN